MSTSLFGKFCHCFFKKTKKTNLKGCHSHLGIAVRQKKAKSKQVPLQAACRGKTGLGKVRERKGDLDTGVTSPPLRAISATVMLQNARLLHFSCPLNYADPRRGQPGPPLSKIRYSPAEIWRLRTCPQQSRITAWGKKIAKTPSSWPPKAQQGPWWQDTDRKSVV